MTKRRKRADVTTHAEHEGPAERSQVPEVGQVLRRAREYWRLSLRDVEKRIGRSNAYLSQVERGRIRQPDPIVLLELAELYRLDFMTLATWAGWAAAPGQSVGVGGRTDSGSIVVRRVLDLNEEQRAKVLSFMEDMLRKPRT